MTITLEPGHLAIPGGAGDVTLVTTDADLRAVLAAVAAAGGRRLEVDSELHATVNTAFEAVPWSEALDVLAAEGGFTWRDTGDRVHVRFPDPP